MSEQAKPKIVKSDAEWRRQLSNEQYYVLRRNGTERAGTSALNHEKRDGAFACAGCGEPLFASGAKFESGTGWPSFSQPMNPQAVTERRDRSLFMIRTEIRCAGCDGHLGHVFWDGPQPTGLRYCVNGAALNFGKSGG